MKQPEIILACACIVAFLLGWAAHDVALTWLQRRTQRRAERIVFAQMSPADRRTLLEQLERVNALRPKSRRVS